YGNSTSGIFGYSGGAFKKSGSQMLVFGGGGGDGWAGNDIRGLRLEDDAPKWETVVNPSPVSLIWQRQAGASHPYLKDGVTPNARHSYFQPQFVDSQNKFYAFGCKNVWETDSGSFYNVDAVSMSTK